MFLDNFNPMVQVWTCQSLMLPTMTCEHGGRVRTGRGRCAGAWELVGYPVPHDAPSKGERDRELSGVIHLCLAFVIAILGPVIPPCLTMACVSMLPKATERNEARRVLYVSSAKSKGSHIMVDVLGKTTNKTQQYLNKCQLAFWAVTIAVFCHLWFRLFSICAMIGLYFMLMMER